MDIAEQMQGLSGSTVGYLEYPSGRALLAEMLHYEVAALPGQHPA